MEALKTNKNTNPVHEVLKVIHDNVTKNAVAAGGALTDMVFNEEYGTNLKPRDIDIFLPVFYTKKKNGKERIKALKNIGGKLEALGLTEYDEKFGVMAGKYREAMIDMLFSLYSGRINGVNVDVILIYTTNDNIINYVHDYFDLDIKTVAYDGNKLIKSKAFEDAFKNSTVGILHPHTPMSSFFRMMDAKERYGLRPDESFYYAASYTAVMKKYLGEFAWRKEIRQKHSRFIEQAEKIIYGLEENFTEAAVMDALRGFMEESPGMARNTFHKYLNSIKEKPLLEVEKIYNPNARVVPQKASVDEFKTIARKLTLPQEVIDNYKVVIMGSDYKTLIERLSDITDEEYSTAKMEINGQTVRVGKVITKIKKYIKNHCSHSNLKEDKAEETDRLKYLLDNRLTEGQEVEFLISKRPEDLMQISVNTPWESCQGWWPGKLTKHNRHLAANLNGLTAVAILKSKSGKWLARCLLRISKNQRAVAREKLYGKHPDFTYGLKNILEEEMMHRNINIKPAHNRNFPIGPFYAKPYGYVFMYTKKHINYSRNEKEKLYYIKPVSRKRERRNRQSAVQQNNNPAGAGNEQLADPPF